MPLSLVVHYGDHPGTTGSHLAGAAEELGIGVGHPLPPRRHFDCAVLGPRDALVWVESGMLSYPLGTERSETPTAGYVIDVHLHAAQSRAVASLFDLVLVAQRDYLPALAEVHPNVHWLPLAAPRAFLDLPRRAVFPVSFVGNVVPGTLRERALRAINAAVPMNDWRRSHSIDELGATYASSRLVINPPAHGDVNMRFFEALACGALVVTPPLANGLCMLAREGEDYYTVDLEDESFVASVLDLLATADFEVRGEAARALVRDRHTYHRRVSEIASLLATAGPVAPVRAMSSKDRGALLLDLATYAADPSLARQAARLGALTPVGAHARVASRAAARWVRTNAFAGAGR
ncbi:MAG TPA: glycosyltransferase [Acidimicrobiales bacterium]|nr:glycosyltransferase [Acidimicrobiales bacterium]